MEYRGNRPRRQSVAEAYSPAQVESVLTACGVEIVGETTNDFLCFCPYHGNKYTPSFSVSRNSGTFICFNHACGETGTLVDLVKATSKRNDFEALRFIIKCRSNSGISFREQMQKALKPLDEFPEFSRETLDRMHNDLMSDAGGDARRYLESRGFELETMREFRLGYSERQQMVITPMYDVTGKPIGLIGRSFSDENKAFKNSTRLPTSKTLWNIHRARRHGDTVVICEANFDAMRIHQAGYPNVVACLGGNFSPYHIEQLDKYFNRIIIMTDFDDSSKHRYVGCKKCAREGIHECRGHNPGRALGETIAEQMKRKTILWASYADRMVYPPGIKDAGDMSDDEIRQCIKGAVSNYEYHTWGMPR